MAINHALTEDFLSEDKEKITCAAMPSPCNFLSVISENSHW